MCRSWDAVRQRLEAQDRDRPRPTPLLSPPRGPRRQHACRGLPRPRACASQPPSSRLEEGRVRTEARHPPRPPRRVEQAPPRPGSGGIARPRRAVETRSPERRVCVPARPHPPSSSRLLPKLGDRSRPTLSLPTSRRRTPSNTDCRLTRWPARRHPCRAGRQGHRPAAPRPHDDEAARELSRAAALTRRRLFCLTSRRSSRSL